MSLCLGIEAGAHFKPHVAIGRFCQITCHGGVGGPVLTFPRVHQNDYWELKDGIIEHLDEKVSSDPLLKNLTNRLTLFNDFTSMIETHV